MSSVGKKKNCQAIILLHKSKYSRILFYFLPVGNKRDISYIQIFIRKIIIHFESSTRPVDKSTILLYRILFLSSSFCDQSRHFKPTPNLGCVLSACSALSIAAFSSLATLKNEL